MLVASLSFRQSRAFSQGSAISAGTVRSLSACRGCCTEFVFKTDNRTASTHLRRQQHRFFEEFLTRERTTTIFVNSPLPSIPSAKPLPGQCGSKNAATRAVNQVVARTMQNGRSKWLCTHATAVATVSSAGAGSATGRGARTSMLGRSTVNACRS